MFGAAMRLSVAVGAAVMAVTAITGSALAHDHGWKKKKWHHHHHQYQYVVPGPAYVVERPVYVRPRPVYVEPMYYGPPPPPSINFNIPLR
jgi:hypothetical protein